VRARDVHRRRRGRVRVPGHGDHQRPPVQGVPLRPGPGRRPSRGHQQRGLHGGGAQHLGAPPRSGVRFRCRWERRQGRRLLDGAHGAIRRWRTASHSRRVRLRQHHELSTYVVLHRESMVTPIVLPFFVPLRCCCWWGLIFPCFLPVPPLERPSMHGACPTSSHRIVMLLVIRWCTITSMKNCF
jgi:hypothetical protein